MQKRTFLIIAAMVAISLILSSCSGTNQAATSSGTNTATTETAAPRRTVAVGETVTFGHYEQDNDTSNGAEPIEWIVASVQGSRALLISAKGLDSQPFNGSREAVTWETCTLRTWLNNDFMYTAFTMSEQDAILLSQVDNSTSQGYSNTRSGGNNTQDKLFILSYAEANRYFPTDEDKILPLTQYAEARLGVSCWWTRSPYTSSADSGSYSMVNFYYRTGERTGLGSVNLSLCVRPALWINLEAGVI